jgi:hypothetical protein
MHGKLDAVTASTRRREGMSFMDEINRVRTRLSLASSLLTEEATKNALVMPMLKALGYDVFDPTIVIPEFSADVGVKRGEKVDYAIIRDSKVAILVEAKTAGTDLSKQHASQLYRYFSVTDARFGILTNGIEWRFFTDLDAPNKMDEKPFFIFSLSEYNEGDLAELDKFSAGKFSVDTILGAASDLKLRSLLSEEVRREMASPSDELVRLIGRRVFSGNLTADIRTRLAVLLRTSFQEVLRDQVNQRLKDAIDRTEPATIAPLPAGAGSGEEMADGARRVDVETTEEEREAYRIIRAIARKVVDPRRIALRDAASYCAILFDDNNRRPIARLYMSGNKKRIGIFIEKSEARYELSTLDDIYNYGDEIIKAVEGYLPKEREAQGHVKEPS